VFDCVGARPPQELLDLKQRDARINVTGYVEDVQPFLQSAGVMIVPLRAGGGMRVKILNALAQGLPIVTTTLGCEGIAVEHGVSALIGDTPEQLAQHVLAVLADRELGDRLGRNARGLFEARYDYRVALRAMDPLFD
jgi:polysaccharide biosynthesis protein PslH